MKVDVKRVVVGFSTLLALTGLSVVAEAQSNTSSVPPELAQMVDRS